MKTYVEAHPSSLAAKAGEEQQNERDEPRARDEDDDVGRRRERFSPGLRHWSNNRNDREEGFKAETPHDGASKGQLG